MHVPARPTQPWLRLAVTAGLVLAVGLVFWPAVLGEFLLWDDDINIRDNPHLQLTTGDVQWMFTDTQHMRRYVPFTWLNWAVERELFGLTARSAHLGNVLLHAANTLLVYSICRAILRILRPDTTPRLIEVAAGIAAATWALHPLRVEPVAWASGRIYCLTAAFLLVSTRSYLAYATLALATVRKRVYWWLALGSFVASLLTYPLGLTFPALLVALDVAVLRRFASQGDRPDVKWAAIREKAWFFAAAFVAGIATVWAAARGGQHWRPPPSLADFGLLERAAQAFYIWSYYVWKPLLPGNLSPVPTALLTVDPSALRFVASAGVVALVTFLLWSYRRFAWRLLAFWLCHLVLLVPFLGLTEHPHYPSDRYSLLVGVLWSVGMAIVFAYMATRASRFFGLGAAMAVVGALATSSHAQVRIWRSSEALFRAMITRLGDHPYRADIFRRLGNLHLDQGRLDEARVAYLSALALVPRSAVLHYDVGRMHEVARDLPAAIAAYRRAHELWPEAAQFLPPLGRCLLATGANDEAAAVFSRSVKLDPTSAEAHSGRTMALMRLGRFREAIEPATRAMLLAPTDATVRLNLATACAMAGELSLALEHARKVLELAPRQEQAYLLLAFIAEKNGDIPGAIAELERALPAAPDPTGIRAALDAMRRKSGH